MSAIYALYDDGDAAQRAVNGLRNAGVADSAITVILRIKGSDLQGLRDHTLPREEGVKRVDVKQY